MVDTRRMDLHARVSRNDEASSEQAASDLAFDAATTALKELIWRDRLDLICSYSDSGHGFSGYRLYFATASRC